MLDERTITVTAFARATSKVRIRRVFLSLLLLLVLATVGTGAAYQAFLNHTPKLNIKQAALLPGRWVLGRGLLARAEDDASAGQQSRLLDVELRGVVQEGLVCRARPHRGQHQERKQAEEDSTNANLARGTGECGHRDGPLVEHDSTLGFSRTRGDRRMMSWGHPQMDERLAV